MARDLNNIHLVILYSLNYSQNMMKEKFSNGETSEEQSHASVACKGDMYSHELENKKSGYVRELSWMRQATWKYAPTELTKPQNNGSTTRQ
ncbi:hypothetical protein H5410_060908, partial [Solanum commersonii]